MKTDDLARYLTGFQEILQCYPGKDVDYVLKDIKKLLQSKGGKDSQPKKEDTLVPSLDYQPVIANLLKMDSREVEEYLLKEPLIKRKTDLLGLAQALNMAFSKRQTLADLRHSIGKYLERQRLDHTIRIKRFEHEESR